MRGRKPELVAWSRCPPTRTCRAKCPRTETVERVADAPAEPPHDFRRRNAFAPSQFSPTSSGFDRRSRWLPDDSLRFRPSPCMVQSRLRGDPAGPVLGGVYSVLRRNPSSSRGDVRRTGSKGAGYWPLRPFFFARPLPCPASSPELPIRRPGVSIEMPNDRPFWRNSRSVGKVKARRAASGRGGPP